MMKKWYDNVPYRWSESPLMKVARFNKLINDGLIENNLLSLSYGKIILKNIDTDEGLLPQSFETYQIVEPGDLILRLTDLQNDKRSLRVGFCPERGIITSAYLCLRPNQDVVPKFLYYTLHTADLVKVFYSMGGGVRQNLRFRELKYLWLPLPPLTEQRAIAEYLDGETARIDGIVERLTTQRTRYEQLKRSLISEVITKGLPHHDPTTFRSLRLKDILFSFESGKRVASNQNEVLSIGGEHIQNGKFFLDNPRYVTEKLYASSNGKIKLGDTLVVKDGATIGKSMYVKDLPEPKMLLNEHVYRLESYTSICMPIYLYFIISNSSTQDYFRAMNMSTAQESITKGTMGNLPIALPSLTEQKEIVDYLDKRCGRIDRIVEAIGRKIELLEALRKSIIEEVVTGKRAVS